MTLGRGKSLDGATQCFSSFSSVKRAVPEGGAVLFPEHLELLSPEKAGVAQDLVNGYLGSEVVGATSLGSKRRASSAPDFLFVANDASSFSEPWQHNLKHAPPTLYAWSPTWRRCSQGGAL